MNARVGTPTIERGPNITGGAPKIDLSKMLGMDAAFLDEARRAVQSADWSLAPTKLRAKAEHDKTAELAAAQEIQMPRGARPVNTETEPGQVVEGGKPAAEVVQRMHLTTVAEVATGGQARTKGATTAELLGAITDGNEGRAQTGRGSVIKEFDQLASAASRIFGDTGTSNSILGTLASPFRNRVASLEPESEILRG